MDRIEHKGLNSMFDISKGHLKDLMESQQKENTRMPGTNFPKEFTQTVSKYLHFASSPQERNSGTVNLHHLVDTKSITAWLDMYQSCAMSGSGVYNKIDYVNKAVQYFVSVEKIVKPPHFQDFVKMKMKVFNKQRKQRSMEKREKEMDDGVIDAKEVYRKIINNQDLKERFDGIVDHIKTTSGKLPPRKFLFCMRLALAHMFVGVCSRPCGLYSLSLDAASKPHSGQWSGEEAVILKNMHHKTFATHGALRWGSIHN